MSGVLEWLQGWLAVPEVLGGLRVRRAVFFTSRLRPIDFFILRFYAHLLSHLSEEPVELQRRSQAVRLIVTCNFFLLNCLDRRHNLFLLFVI